MQYYDQRQKALKRIFKIVAIILTAILCITGIYFLISLNKSDQEKQTLYEQQEQERMLALRPLYEEKTKIENQLSDITYQRNHAVTRSTVFIPLLTDCSAGFLREVAGILQQYDYPAVICISDAYYPGAEGCISVDEAKELTNCRWEFMVDISSDVDKLTTLLLSSGLTKPVAIYSPDKNKNTSIDLPLVCYGSQSDRTLFNAVYGMQTDELFFAAEEALSTGKAIIMTGGTVLPREIYDKSLLLDILSYMEYMGADSNMKICTYSENVKLQAEYNQQQQKVIDETEAEYQSLSSALDNIEEQIKQIETGF